MDNREAESLRTRLTQLGDLPALKYAEDGWDFEPPSQETQDFAFQVAERLPYGQPGAFGTEDATVRLEYKVGDTYYEVTVYAYTREKAELTDS